MLIVVVIPFVMLIYFGLAVIICDKISVGRGWPTTLPLQLSTAEALAMAVTYPSLTVWLWLRWRKLRIRQEGYRDEARRIAANIAPQQPVWSAAPIARARSRLFAPVVLLPRTSRCVSAPFFLRAPRTSSTGLVEIRTRPSATLPIIRR